MNSSVQTITDQLTELLTQLVRFPTVSTDAATNQAALEWIEAQLTGLPLTVKRFENQGRSMLAATTPAVRDPKNPKLWLAAHIDVVAGEPIDFEPSVKNGRVYGRGTHDMKFALATYIALLQELGSELVGYDLGLLITDDEEIGGHHGVGWLVDNHGYRGSAVLLPDSSTPWHLETGAKGVSRIELTATGRAAHASRTWQGVNAIDEIMRYVKQVRTHVPTEPCGDPAHKHATVNLGTISGGAVANQVPAQATAQLDIRFPPLLTQEDINDWITEATIAVPTVIAKKSVFADPYQVADSPAIRTFQRVAAEVTGRPLPSHVAHGSSDARYFNGKGVPTINVGIIGSGYHTSPEWIDLADFTRFYDLTRRFVDAWAKIED